MKQKDKDLLLQDLCGRLPYGVKVKVTPVPSEEYEHIFFNAKIVYIDVDYIGVLSDNGFVLQQDIVELKPYLFPMSSMTDEQMDEYDNLKQDIMDKLKDWKCAKLIHWFCKNHFDYLGLIPLGLGIDCTNLNIY